MRNGDAKKNTSDSQISKTLMYGFIRQFNNLLIIALGALAIIFILRGVFKLAWKVIKIIFIVLGLLVLFGWLFGYIHISLA